MPHPLHILAFAKKLKDSKEFLQSLLCKKVQKRRLLLQKASPKQLKLLQKLCSLHVRGELPITPQVFARIKNSKKLGLLETKFKKITADPNLKQNLLALAPILHLLVRVIQPKKSNDLK